MTKLIALILCGIAAGHLFDPTPRTVLLAALVAFASLWHLTNLRATLAATLSFVGFRFTDLESASLLASLGAPLLGLLGVAAFIVSLWGDGPSRRVGVASDRRTFPTSIGEGSNGDAGGGCDGSADGGCG